jgi:glucans biosynthesis protein C
MNMFKSPRLYYLDWLRILGIIAIFFFHNARAFNIDDWHIKNANTSVGMSLFVDSIAMFIMPLFFLLSGAAIYYALGSRGASKFAADRVLRLGVPLVMGIFLLALPQVYIERLSHGDFTGSFWSFIPEYFNGFYLFGGNFAWMGLHLWYLLALLVFSLAMLPLTRRMKDGSPSLLSRLANRMPGWWLPVLAVPVILSASLLDPDGAGIKPAGGWSFICYLLFFVYGYLIFTSERLKAAVSAYGRMGLVIGAVVAVASGVWFYREYTGSAAGIEFGSTGYTVFYAIWAVGCWGMLIGLLYLGERFLNFRNRFTDYANEAVLPFYILHQTVIVLIGYGVTRWQAPIALKYGILAVLSSATIMLIYEFIVRRTSAVRFLFGMKALPVARAAILLPATPELASAKQHGS